MTEPTEPGQRCRIVGGQMQVNGDGDGPNMGKHVITMYRHERLAGGFAPVWHVRSAVPGVSLFNAYGGVGNEVDCLQMWLEVVPPEPPKTETRNTTEELETA